METPEKKFIEKTYCYVKNIKYSFEFIMLVEAEIDSDGKVIHESGDDFIIVSKPFPLKTEIFEPTIGEQLDLLDLQEKRIRSEHEERLHNALDGIKNKRAALLSLPHIRSEEDDIPV